MDHSLAVVSEDGDMSWSDSNSDDNHSTVLPQSPAWMDAIHAHQTAPHSASISVSSMASRLPLNGQLSPISTGMDVPPGPSTDDSACPSTSESSAAPTMSYSESSSVTDGWSIGYGEVDDGTNGICDHDNHWEQSSDDVLTIPKVEPMDEDFRLDEIKEAPPTPVPSNTGPASVQPKAKRPRGRPRKHPLTPIVTANKVTKGRSKTGCITCRKRKKKCDEAKPRCKLGISHTVYCNQDFLTGLGRYELREECRCV